MLVGGGVLCCVVLLARANTLTLTLLIESLSPTPSYTRLGHAGRNLPDKEICYFRTGNQPLL